MEEIKQNIEEVNRQLREAGMDEEADTIENSVETLTAMVEDRENTLVEIHREQEEAKNQPEAALQNDANPN